MNQPSSKRLRRFTILDMAKTYDTSSIYAYNMLLMIQIRNASLYSFALFVTHIIFILIFSKSLSISFEFLVQQLGHLFLFLTIPLADVQNSSIVTEYGKMIQNSDTIKGILEIRTSKIQKTGKIARGTYISMYFQDNAV